MREAPRRAGDVKEAALLAVARELVQEGEFQATPIGRIAERAGVSRQGFYFYYQSKDELLAQLVTETLYEGQPWRETVYDGEGGDSAEALRHLFAATVVMWRQNREVLGAAVDVAPRSAAVLAQWRAAVDETADFLVDLVISSTRFESLRDPEQARRMMVTLIWMIERNCYMHVVHGSDESDAELGERLGDIGVRALGLD